MHANVGDWLLIRGHRHDQPARRGEILTVRADGAPPYTVRWSADDHEGLVFPGPDARVLTAAQLAEMDSRRGWETGGSVSKKASAS